jgi:hypothetical protein
MQGVTIPPIPAPLWIIAAALTIAVLLITFLLNAYWQRRQAALIKDGGDAADLAARKQQLESDVEELRRWIKEHQNELLQKEAEIQKLEQLRQELTDLEERCLKKDLENESLRKEVGELENRRYTLGQTLAQMQKEIDDFDRKRGETETLNRQLDDMKLRLQEALGEVLDIRKERAQLEAIVGELRSEQNFLGNDNKRLETENIKLEEDLNELKVTARDESKAAKEVGRAYEEALRLLKDAENQKEKVESEVQKLAIRKDGLEREVEKLSGRRPDQTNVEDAIKSYADLLEKAPACLDRNKFLHQWDNADEYYALERFMDQLHKRKLHFSPRVIYAFHTSLKCQAINPLTVLAGVSGTGKTLLPVKYAELMGMHSLVLPVQPRWDSPQDLFGFYNYLEKEYKATDLSRSLIRLDPYNYPPEKFPRLDGTWARKRMFMVLLDEMNLARTEYYFSEFLSKLELRRQVEDRDIPSDREKAEIELDAGPGKDLRFRLWIPHNVLFVGTMNEDETTQTLSDKVLDRANVMRFGKPDDLLRDGKDIAFASETERKFLSFDQWDSWQRSSDGTEPWSSEIHKWIKSLNQGLDKVGRPFGYRVQDTIAHYVANYPGVGEEQRFKTAFADQVEQKIIPKLRGLDVRGVNYNKCMERVESIIDDLDDKELSNAFTSSKEESEELGMFIWRGVTRAIPRN